jgi:NAD(P)-dependent dehydrogenase (short-subunit alcohol dehydrogenase family)
MKRLDGKVAIITGAGSGIGEATARLMTREGASVVVADLNRTEARETCDQPETPQTGPAFRNDARSPCQNPRGEAPEAAQLGRDHQRARLGSQ